MRPWYYFSQHDAEYEQMQKIVYEKYNVETVIKHSLQSQNIFTQTYLNISGMISLSQIEMHFYALCMNCLPVDILEIHNRMTSCEDIDVFFRCIIDESGRSTPRQLEMHGILCTNLKYIKFSKLIITFNDPIDIPLHILILYIYLRREHCKTKIIANDIDISINILTSKIKINKTVYDINAGIPVVEIMTKVPYTSLVTFPKIIISTQYIHYQIVNKYKDIFDGCMIWSGIKYYIVSNQIMNFTIILDGVFKERFNDIIINNLTIKMTKYECSDNKTTIHTRVIPNDILEDPRVFRDDNQLDWCKLGLYGINHFYNYVNHIFEFNLIQDINNLSIILQCSPNYNSIVEILDFY